MGGSTQLLTVTNDGERTVKEVMVVVLVTEEGWYEDGGSDGGEKVMRGGMGDERRGQLLLLWR